MAEEDANAPTLEDTCCDEELLRQPDHKNYDDWCETVHEAKRFNSSVKHVEGARRRHQSRLAVSRTGTIEPIAAMREKFYEQRLLLGLSWYCDSPPASRLVGDGRVLVDWTFVWEPPPTTDLDPKVLVLGPDEGVSFETLCAESENVFVDAAMASCASAARLKPKIKHASHACTQLLSIDV